jgi:hypothetical protein
VYYADVTTANPVLGGSASPVSLVLANNHAATDSWVTPRNAVAAVFMHTSVLNDYVLDVGTRANTDWVVTMPGKHEFYTGTSTTAVTPVAPFTAALTTAGACEGATFTFFDRDEQSTVPPPGGFSPIGSGAGGPGAGQLCWESTVVSIRNGQAHTAAGDVSSTNPRSQVLGSRNVQAVTVLANPVFAAGWIELAFTGTNAVAGITSLAGGDLTASNVALPIGQPQPFGPVGLASGVFTARPHTFFGLPVTGFMVTARTNSSVACTLPSGSAGTCASNYAGLFGHSYRTTITP